MKKNSMVFCGIKEKKADNKGFSLVELIVVVLIIGIIAASITMAVMGNIEKSREATCVYSTNELGKEIAYTIMGEEYTTMEDFIKEFSNEYTVISENHVECTDICQSGGVSTFLYNPDNSIVTVKCSVHEVNSDIVNAEPAK